MHTISQLAPPHWTNFSFPLPPPFSLWLSQGAGEAILRDCVRKTESDGSPSELTPDRVRDLEDIIKEWASNAFRVIALAHKDLDTPIDKSSHVNPAAHEQKLTLDALFAIQDPLRDDVIDAVKVCQDAGIMVRMVTGDNIDTAKAIAKQCGILTEDGQALPGPAFRTMSPAQVDSILPNLQVSSHPRSIRIVKHPASQSSLLAGRVAYLCLGSGLLWPQVASSSRDPTPSLPLHRSSLGLPPRTNYG